MVVIVLLAPHTISIERANITDLTYETISWTAILWVFSHTEGSDIGGPFSTSVLSFPNPVQLVLGAISLMVSLYVFHLMRRFASRPDLKHIGIRLGAALFFLVLPYGAFFSYILDSWMSALTMPLPVMMVAGSAVVYVASKRKWAGM